VAEDLHQFVTTTLYAALKHDVQDLRVFNRSDLVHAAYFHVRRLLLVQPGWTCRAQVAPGDPHTELAPDLVIFRHGVFQVALQLELHIAPDRPDSFPAEQMNERMSTLRQTVINLEATRPAGTSGSAGRGYLIGVFDTDDTWFYPDQAIWEKQSCFWLPVNCREFTPYDEWLDHWQKLARFPAAIRSS